MPDFSYMSSIRPLPNLRRFETDEEFNAVYEPACQALAQWFIQHPDKQLIANSGHAFRLALLNTEGIWEIQELSGRRHTYPDDLLRRCFRGYFPSHQENADGTFTPVSVHDHKGPMNFVAPLVRHWHQLLHYEEHASFSYLPRPYRPGW